jgi:hypothetical protein
LRQEKVSIGLSLPVQTCAPIISTQWKIWEALSSLKHGKKIARITDGCQHSGKLVQTEAVEPSPCNPRQASSLWLNGCHRQCSSNFERHGGNNLVTIRIVRHRSKQFGSFSEKFLQYSAEWECFFVFGE